MILQLNEKDLKKYKPYQGGIDTNMPRLIKEGRTPISTEQIMRRRLEILNSDLRNNYDLVNGWCEQYLTSGDAIIYHPEGKIKIVIGQQITKDINSNSNIAGSSNINQGDRFRCLSREFGALLLNEEVYDKVIGEEIKSDEAYKYVSRTSTTYGETINNKIWTILAGGDIKLLQDYAKEAFKIESNYPTMQIKVVNDYVKSDLITLRTITLAPLDNFENSIASGTDILFNETFLIGINEEYKRA